MVIYLVSYIGKKILQSILNYEECLLHFILNSQWGLLCILDIFLVFSCLM